MNIELTEAERDMLDRMLREQTDTYLMAEESATHEKYLPDVEDAHVVLKFLGTMRRKLKEAS